MKKIISQKLKDIFLGIIISAICVSVLIIGINWSPDPKIDFDEEDMFSPQPNSNMTVKTRVTEDKSKDGEYVYSFTFNITIIDDLKMEYIESGERYGNFSLFLVIKASVKMNLYFICERLNNSLITQNGVVINIQKSFSSPERCENVYAGLNYARRPLDAAGFSYSGAFLTIYSKSNLKTIPYSSQFTGSMNIWINNTHNRIDYTYDNGIMAYTRTTSFGSINDFFHSYIKVGGKIIPCPVLGEGTESFNENISLSNASYDKYVSIYVYTDFSYKIEYYFSIYLE